MPLPSGMAGVGRFEDLLVWQRAHELHIEVWDASESVGRNVAEGFGRFNPGQFAHFLDIARASTQETKALLRKGLVVGYWSEEEFSRPDSLADRAIQSIAKFQRYLRSPQAKANAANRYHRDRQNASNVSNVPNVPNDL